VNNLVIRQECRLSRLTARNARITHIGTDPAITGELPEEQPDQGSVEPDGQARHSLQ
jgi:hypothetical protein